MSKEQQKTVDMLDMYYNCKDRREMRIYSRVIMIAGGSIMISAVTIPVFYNIVTWQVQLMQIVILLIVWLPMVGFISYQLVATSDIAIDSYGVRLYMTDRKYHHIPWVYFENAEFINISVPGYYIGLSAIYQTTKTSAVGVVVPGLSLPHSLLRLNPFATRSQKPYFIVSSFHDRFPELIEKIKRHSGANINRN